MKLYFKMPETIYPYYITELNLAKNILQLGNLHQFWHLYERAHIIGQRYPCNTALYMANAKIWVLNKKYKRNFWPNNSIGFWWFKKFCRHSTYWQYRRRQCATTKKNENSKRYSSNAKRYYRLWINIKKHYTLFATYKNCINKY